MNKYFIKVSSECSKLDNFLKNCNPLNDDIIIQIDSYGTGMSNITNILEKYPWVKVTWTHITDYHSSVEGYNTLCEKSLQVGLHEHETLTSLV